MPVLGSGPPKRYKYGCLSTPVEVHVQKAEPGAKQMQAYMEMVRQRLGKPLLLQKLTHN